MKKSEAIDPLEHIRHECAKKAYVPDCIRKQFNVKWNKKKMKFILTKKDL